MAAICRTSSHIDRSYTVRVHWVVGRSSSAVGCIAVSIGHTIPITNPRNDAYLADRVAVVALPISLDQIDAFEVSDVLHDLIDDSIAQEEERGEVGAENFSNGP